MSMIINTNLDMDYYQYKYLVLMNLSRAREVYKKK